MADQGKANAEQDTTRWTRLIPVVIIAVLLTVLNSADVPNDWIQSVGGEIIALTRIDSLENSLLRLINIVLFWFGIVFSFRFMYGVTEWLSSSFSKDNKPRFIRLFRSMIWMLFFLLLHSFVNQDVSASWVIKNLREYSGFGLLEGVNRTLMSLFSVGVLIAFVAGIVALVQILIAVFRKKYSKVGTKSGLKRVHAMRSDDKLEQEIATVKPINFGDMSFVRVKRTGQSALPDEMLCWNRNDRIEVRDGAQVIQLLQENGEAFILGSERISLPINTPYVLYEQTAAGREISKMTITYIK